MNSRMISCQELFQLFEKQGGQLICNHHKKQCVFQGQTCDLTLKVDMGTLLFPTQTMYVKEIPHIRKT